MQTDLALIYQTYQALNARDLDAALATMVPDVDWPSGWVGGRIQGHAALREYWTQQWAQFDFVVQPVGFHVLSDGRLRLDVRQTVRDRAGRPLGDGTVHHVYSFRDGLIARMDIE